MCVCGSVPSIDNRTHIHIIQHPRERRHPVGTVRLLKAGLQRVTVHVMSPHDEDFSGLESAIPATAGFLFPGPGARFIDDLEPHERPDELLVLDGTWGQARALFREGPWMAQLPRFVLKPPEPSRYRIRKEPKAEFVSTLEAVLYALRALEPDTVNLDGLMPAFEGMIDAQIAAMNANPDYVEKTTRGG